MRSATGRGASEGDHLLPSWVGPVFVVLGILLIPWAVLLAWDLPRRHFVATHWRLIWVGFDLFLAAALIATAAGAFRRAPWSAIPATISATLLFCDAWFDVLTSHPGRQVVVALAEAILVELPLAALCLALALNTERILAAAYASVRRASWRTPPEPPSRGPAPS